MNMESSNKLAGRLELSDIKVPPHYKYITSKAKNLATSLIKLSRNRIKLRDNLNLTAIHQVITSGINDF